MRISEVIKGEHWIPLQFEIQEEDAAELKRENERSEGDANWSFAEFLDDFWNQEKTGYQSSPLSALNKRKKVLSTFYISVTWIHCGKKNT